MPYGRRGMSGKGQVIHSTKNVFDSSNVLVASTNTTIAQFIDAVDAPVLADPNGVLKNSKVYSTYLSVFVFSEGGELATEVPLVDWYVIKDNGTTLQTSGFTATGFPTPGATGTHQNKRFILHEEKGLAGGGDASLAGVPMVFKGVIKIPRGMQTFRIGDRLTLNIRANFAAKTCVNSIYELGNRGVCTGHEYV